jgi:YD repeat-containing protein
VGWSRERYPLAFPRTPPDHLRFATPVVPTGGGVSWTYTYDDANRLTAATEFNAQRQQVYKVAYAYDVFGNRIEQDVWTSASSAPTVQRFAYDGE